MKRAQMTLYLFILVLISVFLFSCGGSYIIGSETLVTENVNKVIEGETTKQQLANTLIDPEISFCHRKQQTTSPPKSWA